MESDNDDDIPATLKTMIEQFKEEEKKEAAKIQQNTVEGYDYKFPPGFKRVGFLEKTEFNLSLLGIDERTGQSVCVKQYSKSGNQQAVDLARKEIAAYQMIEKEMDKQSEGSEFI